MYDFVLTHIGFAKYLFLENALKKTTEYFLKFLFFFESTILPVNNGQMAASAGHAAAYTIGFLSTLSIACSCISPTASRILSFKASIVSGLSG